MAQTSQPALFSRSLIILKIIDHWSLKIIEDMDSMDSWESYLPLASVLPFLAATSHPQQWTSPWWLRTAFSIVSGKKKPSTCHCKNQTAKQLSLRLQQLLLRCYPKWSQLVSPCLESYCDPVRSYCKFAYLICQIRHSVSHLDRWRMSGLFQTWKCGFVHHLAEFHLEILDELLMNSDICWSRPCNS